MSQYVWESILVNYFTTVKAIDAECEDIRVDLCLNSSFVPLELFNAIDNDSKAFLSLNDFKDFLSSKYVLYEEESLRRFIHNFDKDNDFSIDFNEFLSIVLPRNNFSVKSSTEQRKPREEAEEGTQQKRMEIDAKTESTFIKLIQKEFALVQQLAQIAEELKNSKDFTTYEAFLAIVHDDKYITEDNLEAFLKQNGVSTELNDVATLLFRLDSDDDGKISYEEFQEVFFPYKIFSYSFSKANAQRPQQVERSMQQSKRSIDKDSSVDMRESSSNKPRYQSYQYDSKVNFLQKDSLRSNANELSKNRENLELKYDNNNALLGSTNMSSFKTSDDFNRNKDVIAKGAKSSPRRETSLMNMEMDYRARLNTYTCLERDNCNLLHHSREASTSPRQRLFSPIRFNKSPLRSQIRTEAKLSPMRTDMGKETYHPLTCCCHLTSCCSCCCNERQKTFNLFTLLNDLATQDAKVEGIKEQLAFCPDANLTDLFAFFDVSHRNTIGPTDLIEALKMIGLAIPLNDSKMLYKSFDKNLDGRFDFEEFSEMILPKKYEIAKLINDRLPSVLFIGFNYQTKRILSSLFSAVVDSELSHERYRCILSTTPNNSIFESFNKLKNSYSSGIYKEDIVCFMEENGSCLTPFELELLMDRLDKNQDGIISYNEFISEISPRF